jgi:hypothetical protein
MRSLRKAARKVAVFHLPCGGVLRDRLKGAGSRPSTLRLSVAGRTAQERALLSDAFRDSSFRILPRLTTAYRNAGSSLPTPRSSASVETAELGLPLVEAAELTGPLRISAVAVPASARGR